MAYTFKNGWNLAANNNGATAAQITTILLTANTGLPGDKGTLEKLAADSDLITVEKGIHPGGGLHITVDYVGQLWHVNLTSTGPGVGDYIVANVTK